MASRALLEPFSRFKIIVAVQWFHGFRALCLYWPAVFIRQLYMSWYGALGQHFTDSLRPLRLLLCGSGNLIPSTINLLLKRSCSTLSKEEKYAENSSVSLFASAIVFVFCLPVRRACAKNPPQNNNNELVYTKSVLKKGDKTNFPKKGDTVSCWYTGTLEDGTVFDTNIPAIAKKKRQTKPLSFKVGMGRVIRGWDEGILTMSKGETARLEIEPEWAYGKKGVPDSKIPPNAKLIFEVELVAVD